MIPPDEDVKGMTLEELQQKVMQLRLEAFARGVMLEDVQTERDRFQFELETWKWIYLDKPEDRLYHAEDGTWWMRTGERLTQASPPMGWMKVQE